MRRNNTHLGHVEEKGSPENHMVLLAAVCSVTNYCSSSTRPLLPHHQVVCPPCAHEFRAKLQRRLAAAYFRTPATCSVHDARVPLTKFSRWLRHSASCLCSQLGACLRVPRWMDGGCITSEVPTKHAFYSKPSLVFNLELSFNMFKSKKINKTNHVIAEKSPQALAPRWR